MRSKFVTQRCAFTLVELLTVIAILAILGAILLPSLAKGKGKALDKQCFNNLRQMGLAMSQYSDDHHSLLPAAHGVVPWDSQNPVSWSRGLASYIGSTNNLKCPNLAKIYIDAKINFFMGARAAFIQTGGQAASLSFKKIEFPAAYILSGDNNFEFPPEDTDADNYTQDTLFAKPSRVHSKKLHILFADSHIEPREDFTPATMTFSYDKIGVEWEGE